MRKLLLSQNKYMDLKRIEISEQHKKDIAHELNITTQTVRNSLRYIYNGKNAQKVRLLAKQKLQKEADSVIIKIIRKHGK